MTKEQEEYIREHWETMGNSEIARNIGISRSSVRGYGERNIGRKPDKFCADTKPFTEETRAFIMENYAMMDNSVIAEKLGIKQRAVCCFAHKNGLKKSPNYVKKKIRVCKLLNNIGLDDETIEYIKEHYADETTPELAQRLGVGAEKVRYIGKKLHLRKSEACKVKIYNYRNEMIRKGRQEKLDNMPEEEREEIERKKREKEEREELRRTRSERPKTVREKTEKKPKVLDKDYKFTPDKELIRLCTGEETRKPKGEPCIKEKCKCYKYCKKTMGKNMEICDSYIASVKIC